MLVVKIHKPSPSFVSTYVWHENINDELSPMENLANAIQRKFKFTVLLLKRLFDK